MMKKKWFVKVLAALLSVIAFISGVLSYEVVGKANGLDNIDLQNSIVPGLISRKNIVNNNISVENIHMGEESLKIAVMNDFHYFSRELYSECYDFNYECKSQKKLLLESDAILNKAIEEIKKLQPDVILVGGDMTKDGERVNHEKVAEKLRGMREELHASGVNTQIYVTNGNHDINSDARDYSHGQTEFIHSINSAEFKEIYKDFGYGEESEFYTTTTEVGGCLSYATDIGKGYTLIVVDTNKYTPDQTKTGKAVAEVSGMISDELLMWIEDKADEAYSKGNTPIVLQHHSIMNHFTLMNLIAKGFVIDDSDKICNAYANAGIKIVFSGHAHASDIAKAEIENENEVYDIMTSSLVGYPITTRTVNLKTEENVLKFDTDVRFYDEIDYIDEDTGEKIVDVQAYAYDKCMGVDATEILMSENTVEYILNVYKNRGGSKAAIAKALGVETDCVTDEIIKLLKAKLPSKEDNAIEVSISKFKFGIFYSQDKDAVYLKQKTKNKKSKLAVELYIPIDELKIFIEDMFINIDKNILENPDEVNDVFQKIVSSAFEYKIDNKFTLYEYYVFGFDYYKIGLSCTEEKIEEYLGELKQNHKIMKRLINTVVYKSCKKELVKLLALNKLDLNKLIKAGNNNITSRIIVKVIVASFDDLGDVWKKVCKRVILSDKVVSMINNLGIKLVEGLAVDTNVSDDNNCVIEIPRNINKK